MVRRDSSFKRSVGINIRQNTNLKLIGLDQRGGKMQRVLKVTGWSAGDTFVQLDTIQQNDWLGGLG
jgi:hypothetical protein